MDYCVQIIEKGKILRFCFNALCCYDKHLSILNGINVHHCIFLGTKVTDQPVVLERDQTKRNYLHPVAGSDAAKVGAGLFMKPMV
jgi:hypothetical protein